MKTFDIVVAVDSKNGISRHGKLAWKLSADLKHFKELTTTTHLKEQRNAVIMGRKTWESLPESARPLPDRLNIILSHRQSLTLPPDSMIASSIDEALLRIEEQSNIDHIFIIGGSAVYKESITDKRCSRLYITRIASNYDCDLFFPEINDQYEVESESSDMSEAGVKYRFITYRRKSDSKHGL